MKRDMVKTAALAEDKKTAYDLSAAELNELVKMITDSDGLFTALVTAFNYGFVLGHRATRSGSIKGRL